MPVEFSPPFQQPLTGGNNLDGNSDSTGSLWSRIVGLFHKNHEELLERAIKEASEEGELEPQEGSMLLSVLRLDELQVQDIMIPRTDIVYAEVNTPISEVVDLITQHGHSRIPVYRETRDNIVGIAYAKDLLALLKNDVDISKPIEAHIREPYLVPETKKVKELLQEFLVRKNHMAVAIDEYGGTSGLATIEDVIEVIIGDIEDEYDAPKIQEIEELEDGSLLLSGRAMLEDLEPLGIILDSEEVETIGGYLCMLAGKVPLPGEEFHLAGRVFEIIEADAKQIKRINVGPAQNTLAMGE